LVLVLLPDFSIRFSRISATNIISSLFLNHASISKILPWHFYRNEPRPPGCQRIAGQALNLSACHWPIAETHASLASDPVAKRQHHIQVVMGYVVLFAIDGSCSVKPNN